MNYFISSALIVVGG